MDELVFRKLKLSDKEAFKEATENWDEAGKFQFFLGYNSEKSFEYYLQTLADYEKGINLPKDHVPSTKLFAFIGKDIVARSSIRHELNNFLHSIGGHIGYGVFPKFRRKGIATKILTQSLEICKELGLDKVLVTCDDDNIGSIRTIKNNNGVLENKVPYGDSKVLKRRYWISLKS